MSTRPVDKIANEAILLKKCGRGSNHDTFYNWCMDLRPGRTITNITCDGITGVQGSCTYEFRIVEKGSCRTSSDGSEGGIVTTQGPDFSTTRIAKRSGSYQQYNRLAGSYGEQPNIYKQAYAYQSPPDDSSSSTTGSSTIETTTSGDVTTPEQTSTTILTTESPPRVDADFEAFSVCQFGPGKTQTDTNCQSLTSSQIEEIQRLCDQELNGPPLGIPFWLLMIIILLVIGAVGGAAYLFWKYWLRRRIYGPDPGEPMSTMGSMWTSAPVSAASSMASGGSTLASSGSHRRPSTSGSASQQPSQPNQSRPSSAQRTLVATASGRPLVGSVRSSLSRNNSVSRSRSRSRSGSGSGSRTKNPISKFPTTKQTGPK